jgi:hypothetical protein
VLTRCLVRDFREASDELLEDVTHDLVRHGVWVEVQLWVEEATEKAVEPVDLLQFRDGRVELEGLEDV